MSVTVNLTNFRQKLGDLKSRANYLDPPLRGFANYIEVETRKQFDFGVDPNGIPWAALKPQTLEQKIHLGFPDDILRRTLALENSFFSRVESKRVVLGFSSPIAIYHQEGTEKMPQRKLIEITPEREQKALTLLKTYIRGRG